MRRFRSHVGSLIGFILICGIAFAALRESTDWWEKGTFTLIVLVLLGPVLLAIHRTGARRAFWLGFSLFGFVYLSLSSIPPVESRLVTSKVLGFVYPPIPGMNIPLVGPTNGSGSQGLLRDTIALSATGTQLGAWSNGSIWTWDAATGTHFAWSRGTPANFVKIGHTFIALLLAWLGGILSRRLFRASTSVMGHG
jgi:hypothetical protein